MKLEITITGTTPLLCNRFTDEAQMAATSRTSSALTGDKGTPKEQANVKLYRGADDKTLIIPGPNMLRCIIDGGVFFKNGRSKVTTQKTSLIPACVSIEQMEIPIISDDPWEVDSRPVRNPATGGRFLCHRPMFHNWSLTFTIDLDTELMSSKLLRDIIDASAKRIGLGDYRPACKGPFGKFVVTNWQPIDESKSIPKGTVKVVGRRGRPKGSKNKKAPDHVVAA